MSAVTVSKKLHDASAAAMLGTNTYNLSSEWLARLTPRVGGGPCLKRSGLQFRESAAVLCLGSTAAAAKVDARALLLSRGAGPAPEINC